MKIVLWILLSLGVSSCKTLDVYNVQGCVEKTRGDATCGWSIEGEKTKLPAEVNLTERIGKICFTPEHFGAMRKSIEKACVLLNCTVAEIEAMEFMFLTFDELLEIQDGN